MCSSRSARLARIYRAIEELASRSGHGPGESGGPSGPAEAAPTAGGRAVGAEADGTAAGGNVADDDGDSAAEAGGESATDTEGEGAADADVASRLAEIWAMMADADPELAKRLPRYLGPNS